MPIALLARGYARRPCIVNSVKSNGVFANADKIGNIKAKRGISARMTADKASVNVNRRLVIDRTEMKDYPSLLLLGLYIKASFIPNRRDKILISDSRKLAFYAKWDDYPLRKAAFGKQSSFGTAVAEIEFEFPFAVKIFPSRAHKLRLRVFCAIYHKLPHSTNKL